MAKYGVTVIIDATVYVEVEAESEAEAKGKALDMEKPYETTLCHHCANILEVGDPTEECLVVLID